MAEAKRKVGAMLPTAKQADLSKQQQHLCSSNTLSTLQMYICLLSKPSFHSDVLAGMLEQTSYLWQTLAWKWQPQGCSAALIRAERVS